MLSVKRLIEIVKNNSIDDLINSYKKEVRLSETESIQLTSFSTDRYILEYRYSDLQVQTDINAYEVVRQIWKEVVFNKYTKEILHVELTNTHSKFEGLKISYKEVK